jgi:exopolysaccharide biosynthesis polyprenyl glycosylphosphotransferase
MSTVGHTIDVAGSAVATGESRPRGWLIRRGLVAADVAGLVLAFSVTETIFGGMTHDQAFSTRTEVVLFLFTLPVWILLARLYGLYDRDETRTDHRTTDDLGGVLHLTTVGTWIVIAGSRVTGIAHPSLIRVSVFWALAVSAIFTTRSIARRVCRQHESYVQNTLVVGIGREGLQIAERLRKHPEFGLTVVGFVDTNPGEAVPGFDDLRVVGSLDDLPRLVRERHVGRVVMGFTEDGHAAMLRQIRELNACGVQVDVIPRFPELIGPEVDLHTSGGITLWSLRPFRFSRSSRMMKRLVDIAVSFVALVLLAPLFAIVAAAIKLDSRGTVFFRQERIRDGERTFRMWKFRTMTADADERKHEIAHLNIHARNGGDGKMFKAADDPRVTRVGRLLRRYSIDELPQLLNVLSGEMSLVGPRPLIPEEQHYVTEWRRRRLSLRPGVTGLWQVNGRSDLPFEDMVALDYRYVTNWSPWLDLGLILKTIPQVLRGAAEAQ